MTRGRNACGAGCVSEGSGPAIANAGPEIGEGGREPVPRAAKIRSREDNSGTGDADADLACPGDRQQEGRIRVHPAGRAKQVTGDNRDRVAGEGGGVGREIAQQRGGKGAGRSPQGQAGQKQDAVLGKTGDEHHAHRGADERADHAEPALAQRGAELRLTDDCRRRTGPVGTVELKPERRVKRKGHRRPQP
jgi:hypothetical protein